MPVELKLTTTNGGEIDFSAYGELPLISRRFQNQRSQSEGHMKSRLVTVTLTGFLEGNNHSEIVAAYQAMIAKFKDNTATFYWHDGSSVQANNVRVYIDTWDEPSDWKEYDGNYSVSFHYHEKVTQNSTDLGIAASIVSGAGTHTFNPVPYWSKSSKTNKKHPAASTKTPADNDRGSTIEITLTGTLIENDHASLAAQMASLELACSENGTLNYGTWAESVYISEGPTWGTTFPDKEVDYTIKFLYWSSTIFDIDLSITYSRIHNHPVIDELPYCGVNYVEEINPSGQTVQYSLMCQAASITAARTILSQEAAVVVHPNGVEMKGGSERQEESTNRVTVTFSKYHSVPVLANLTNT